MLSRTDIILVTVAVIIGGLYTSGERPHVPSVIVPHAKVSYVPPYCTEKPHYVRIVAKAKARAQRRTHSVSHRLPVGGQVLEQGSSRNGQGGVERLHGRQGGTVPETSGGGW